MLPVLIIIALLLTCACNREPVYYPPPEQRHPSEGAAPLRASMMVNMNDEDAPLHFVQDISPALEGSTWRWTAKRPSVKMLLVKTNGLKFAVDFTLPGQTMQQTGPVNIAFFIDDKLLDSVHYDKPGYQHYEKLVQPGWVQTVNETVVSAEIDKLYTSPGDGRQLGFILVRMGFERQ